MSDSEAEEKGQKDLQLILGELLPNLFDILHQSLSFFFFFLAFISETWKSEKWKKCPAAERGAVSKKRPCLYSVVLLGKKSTWLTHIQTFL